jgi:magnesium-transporting ATPase (P-type)
VAKLWSIKKRCIFIKLWYPALNNVNLTSFVSFRYITNDNILLRGCYLKIVPSVYGTRNQAPLLLICKLAHNHHFAFWIKACAIYTGQDTKMMLNSIFKSNKKSCVERRLNIFFIIFFTILFIMTAISYFGMLSYNYLYSDHWYLKGREPDDYFVTLKVF